LKQLALLLMIPVIARYDPCRGAFSTVAYRYLGLNLYRTIIHDGLIRTPLNAHPGRAPHAYCVPEPVDRGEEANSDDALDDQDAIRRLPPRLRYVIRRRFWDDLTFNDMAAEVGVKSEQGRQLLVSALGMLRND
jgi:DNA-directed RNA polymerase specialized sigma24 family protein